MGRLLVRKASSAARRARLDSPPMRNAEAPRPLRGDQEECEAVDDRALAAVLQGQRALRLMELEIRDSHLAAREECRDPGEEAQKHERSARKLDGAADPHLTPDGR